MASRSGDMNQSSSAAAECRVLPRANSANVQEAVAVNENVNERHARIVARRPEMENAN